MYWIVPIKAPTSVCRVVTTRSESVLRATPKSMTFGTPLEVTKMLLGLRSR